MVELFSSLARHRLLHFALLGGLIFFLSRRAHPARDEGIELSLRTIDALCEERRRELGVSSLDPQQRARVVSEAIEDELLFREAIRRGLTRDDELVRKRLVARDLETSDEMLAASQAPIDSERRSRAAAEHLRKLFASQRVTIDGKPVESYTPTGRLPAGAP